MFHFYNNNDCYQFFIKQVNKYGDLITVRNNKVKELLNVQICISNPRDRIVTDTNRKLRLKTCISEFLWYMTANNSVDVVTPYIKNWGNFADDGKVNSNYGVYFKRQVAGILDKIKSDRYTRQAIVSIYNESFNNYNGKDTPCTLSVHFQLREDKLNMTVNMRSNDVVHGLPLDMFQFSLFQEIIANEIGCDVGSYVHVANNLHVYENFFNLEASEHIESKIMSTDVKFLSFWDDIYKLKEGDFIKHCLDNSNVDLEHFKMRIAA